jgi:hypothetical protein
LWTKLAAEGYPREEEEEDVRVKMLSEALGRSTSTIHKFFADQKINNGIKFIQLSIAASFWEPEARTDCWFPSSLQQRQAEGI